MLDFSFKATGADQFRRAADPRGAITKASWNFMRRQGAVFLKHAIAEAPVGRDWSQDGGFNLPGHPGMLQRSHQLRVMNPFHGEVVNTAPYATFVASGTRPHFPPASSGLPWPVRRAIGEHGTPANPWFDRAFQLGLQEVQANMDQMAADVLKEISGV